ncbi:hypothetical protein Ping_2811 [Psychromonas ingrahamii 37]|uniref:TIGR02808 family protein n=1 Tax=Psychromonas ingrahamii (strain DSM 17664 / CCUG 51855 / 37) TaxID=357804 RepID=A1SYF2_PSYIN|nr:TIGR02808 family protein [Psychromonas ingrahamii]ABM04517.1 hypothetical protein Ping_2811 [Psychromonas ingrahamii 37]
MSELESVLWHIAGYAAIPTIFVAGFIGVSVAAIIVLKISGATPITDKVS